MFVTVFLRELFYTRGVLKPFKGQRQLYCLCPLKGLKLRLSTNISLHLTNDKNTAIVIMELVAIYRIVSK